MFNDLDNPDQFGVIPETAGHPAEYFRIRGILLDCRGPLAIDPLSKWGFIVKVWTASHHIHKWPRFGAVVPYGVRVDAHAWIGSCAVLAGCHIGTRAIVAVGAVVRGQTVAPDVMVAGNPARVIARWNKKKREWVYLSETQSGYARELA